MPSLQDLREREKKLEGRVTALIKKEGRTPVGSPARPKVLKELKEASDALGKAQQALLDAERDAERNARNDTRG